MAAAVTMDPYVHGSEMGMNGVADSLNRIEKLLDRGQQLLYGDDDYNEVSPVSDTGEPLDSSVSGVVRQKGYYSSHAVVAAAAAAPPPPPAAAPPPSKLTGKPSRGMRGAAAAAPNTMSRSHQDLETSYQKLLASNRQKQKVNGSRHHLHSGIKPLASTPSRLRLSGSGERDTVSFSASARAREIAQIKKSGGSVPNLEDGVDANDTPQNITIEELKARIHRELEEYQRNGPIMLRRPSYAKKGTIRPDSIRRPITPQPKTTTTPAATRLRASATPAATRVSQRQAVKPQVSRTVVGPNRATGAKKPSAPASQVKQPSPARRQASTSPTTTSSIPIWERLYHDASAQQKRSQRLKDRHLEAEVARRTPPKKQTRTSPQPSHLNRSQPSKPVDRKWRPLQMGLPANNGSTGMVSPSQSDCFPPHHSAKRNANRHVVVPGRNGQSDLDSSACIPAPHSIAANSPSVSKKQSEHVEESTFVSAESGAGGGGNEIPPFITPLDLTGIKK